MAHWWIFDFEYKKTGLEPEKKMRPPTKRVRRGPGGAMRICPAKSLSLCRGSLLDLYPSSERRVRVDAALHWNHSFAIELFEGGIALEDWLGPKIFRPPVPWSRCEACGVAELHARIAANGVGQPIRRSSRPCCPTRRRRRLRG